MRLVLYVFLLATIVVSGISAEWTWKEQLEAKPQSFQVFDDYVIAVGTRDKLEPVKSYDIVRALEDGREIRSKYAKIEGDINFHRKVEKGVYFIDATFSEGANFSGAEFSGLADFSNANFSRGGGFREATFSAWAEFRGTTFSGEADFRYTTFSEAFFVGATFSGEANFAETTFSAAFFVGATFSGEANFAETTFSAAFFFGATFSGEANFAETTFSGEADFRYTTFSRWATFRHAKFSTTADFNICSFEKGCSFLGCIYPDVDKLYIRIDEPHRSNIRFEGVTGFSQMEMEWEYDARYDYGEEYSQDEIKRRGLKGHLDYDETFYIALIKNYRDMGWLSQADDAYYTYRKEKRKQRPDSWHRKAELIMLEVPFGYGVKPFMLLRSFIVLWIPFSFYYALCLRYKPNSKLLYQVSSGGRRFRRSLYDKCWRCFWGLLHSFDTLTPGIEFHSLKSLEQSRYQFNEKLKLTTWVVHAQRFLGWYLLVLFLILFGKIWVR